MRLYRSVILAAAFALPALHSGCSTGRAPDLGERLPAEVVGPLSSDPSKYPSLTRDLRSLRSAVESKLRRKLNEVPLDRHEEILRRIVGYLAFLGIESHEIGSAAVERAEGDQDSGEGGAATNTIFPRLVQSSTQFIYCPDLGDWECLEKDPLLPPAPFRQPRDPRSRFGTPHNAGSRLDITTYFTQGFDIPANQFDHTRVNTLAKDVGRLIREHGNRRLWMALYGIDAVDGSMKPVFDSLRSASTNRSIDLKAVVDLKSIAVPPPGRTWVFSYSRPTGSDAESWIFDSGAKDSRVKHEYESTPQLMSMLNDGIARSNGARLRAELPDSNIMHNKFLIMEDKRGRRSVWTGTANFSDSCMGSERNTNMGIFIQNDAIADAFSAEFRLMFDFDDTINLSMRKLRPPAGDTILRTGRFHRQKIPVSQRYFTFDDGTEARVYFAPTGDAEHRAILPMLLSAGAGDHVRIAMFGGYGYEYVRAMQYAAARGAKIEVVLDSVLAKGQASWTCSPRANLFESNPYLGLEGVNRRQIGSITVRESAWDRKNHLKAASLTRVRTGERARAEILIVGSQNWSAGGNDDNDENLIIVRNRTADVSAAVDFNRYFDDRVSKKSREISRCGNRRSGESPSG